MKYEVSEQIMGAAMTAYDSHDAGSLGQFFAHAPAMHAAITAAINASGLVDRLTTCEDRLIDLLQVDDGQASKEARKYLKKHRPELFAPLNKDTTNDQ